MFRIIKSSILDTIPMKKSESLALSEAFSPKVIDNDFNLLHIVLNNKKTLPAKWAHIHFYEE